MPRRDGPDDTGRWRAVVDRDAQAAESFVYAVRTTGVYCRPGCASRRPRRDNVLFFDTPEEAEAAGYRPCRRCRPNGREEEGHAALVRRACRRLENEEETPVLADLAAEAGLSPWHFQRLFKRLVGVTPRQYAAARRMERFRAGLRQAETVTAAAYDAGFGSSGRAYEAAARGLGMAPGDYRRGGAGLRIRYATARCSLGWLVVAASERGVCAIGFVDSPAEAPASLRQAFPRAALEAAEDDFRHQVARVVAWVDAPAPGALDLPLDIRGTAFQQRVWQCLQAIPPGETATYEEVADRLGQPRSARAVARACAANPLAVAVPCHRVVRKDGGLGGYRWGLARKRALLRRERGEQD